MYKMNILFFTLLSCSGSTTKDETEIC